MAIIAVISDIHSNWEALTEALEIIRYHEPDEILCLGDIVGYGPEPGECLALIKEKATHVIQGNHDAGVSDEATYQRMNSLAMAGIDHARRSLDIHSKDYLTGLPRVMTELTNGLAIAHGSLCGDHFEYIMDSLSAMDNFSEMTTPCLFVGHSHQAFISQGPYLTEHGISLPPPTFSTCRHEGKTTYQLKEDHRYIINPGSVGQPRDIPLGSLCLYDSDRHQVTFIRFPYDVERTKEKIIKAKLPDWAWQRLILGK